MGADLSRVRFDALRDHSGVILQQGRLLLDADWNELVAILQRRLAAGVADLASKGPTPGIAGVAVVPRTTPDAFRVTLTAGALSIGRGRLYVDGLLAENHGLAPLEWDPMLAGLRGTVDTPYAQQPYWPDPEPLPQTGRHLAYLDVWEREVTPVEAPDLVEPAVGVDTTVRTQTVWQVRLHSLGDSDAGCGTADADIPEWTDVIAPSGARLTVGTIEVSDDDDACALPPTGGFRGPEHQTYRVEIHDGGGPGSATFVWSRDNGSVVSPVLEVLPGGAVLRPASLGKDDVLSFSDGDWVEISDDNREFGRLPGELRRIEVNEEDGTLTVDPVLPADLQLGVADAASRHLRIRRWDQSGVVKSGAGATLADLDAPGATGAIVVPALATTQVVLEYGLVVSFSSAGGAFRTGDHWIFPARAADAIGGPIPPDEPRLTEAPPLGVHHHYARLGVLDFPDGETDCRTPWPDCDCADGECSDCTVCVTPESHASGALTIQQAVEQVRAAGGGTVCLATGLYPLDEGGVLIEGLNTIRVRGQGARTILLAREQGVRVVGSSFVRLEDFTVFSAGNSPAVTLQRTVSVTVGSLILLMLRSPDTAPAALALGGVALGTVLRDNVVVGVVGIGGLPGDQPTLLTAELDIRDNLLVCRDSGIEFTGIAGHVLANAIRANTLLRCRQAGVRLTGMLAGSFEVGDNAIVVGGAGIEVGTAGFTVSGNTVSGLAESLELKGDGIAVVPGLGKQRGSTRIVHNVVRDVGGRGIAALGVVEALEVASNRVERAQHGIVMDDAARADTVAVAHNTVTDIGSRPEDASDGVLGVRVLGARRASVESNTVDGVGTARETQGASVGLEVFACTESRVAGNAVARVGFAEAGGRDIGIAVRGRIARSLIEGNTSARQPVEVDDDRPAAFHGLLVGADAHPLEPGLATVGGWVFGTGASSFVLGSHSAFAISVREASVTVDANILAGAGEVPAVLVGVGGDVVFTSNHVHQRTESAAAALRIVARSATVGQNRLRGGRPSGEVDVDPKRIAVLGNLSSLPILNFGGALDARWNNLNQTGF